MVLSDNKDFEFWESLKSPKGKGAFIGSLLLAIVLFAAVGMSTSFVSRVSFDLFTPTINLNKYVTITVDGYDTVGKADVEFDREKFKEDYEKKLASKVESTSDYDSSDYEDLDEYLGELVDEYEDEYENIASLFGDEYDGSTSGTFLSECVDGSLDKVHSLSNGDVVTYTWSCDDSYALQKYGYKLKYSNIEYKVSGLKKAETFDPFEGMEIAFSGVGPEGTAEISGTPTNSEAKDLTFSCSQDYGLSNGDTIVVSVNSPSGEDIIDYCMEQFGKIPSPIEKDYTVEGLDSYVTSAADITEDSLKQMQDKAVEVYNNQAQSWDSSVTLNSFTYMGTYFLSKKKDADNYGCNNALYLLYKTEVHIQYADEYESYDQVVPGYWYIYFTDILTNNKGEVSVSLDSYRTPYDEYYVEANSDDWWGLTWYFDGYEEMNSLKESIGEEFELEYYDTTVNVDDNAAATALEQSSNVSTSDEDGIIFSNSSDTLLDTGEIAALSDEDLRLAINELYARHGYTFKDQGLLDYYKKFDWYQPTVSPDEFSFDLFNDTEKANVQAMQEERDSR